MGPERNSELFEEAAQERLEVIDDEFERRNVSASTMLQLAEEIKRKQTTVDFITEATLYARLYALTQVQRTQIGMDKLVPLRAIHYQNDSSVKARQAPPHDSFSPENKGQYLTRAIKIELPGYEGDEDIHFFGLNVYQPDIEPLSLVDSSVNATDSTSEIAIVRNKDGVGRKEEPITGETVVFAAVSRKTGDVKFYTVKVSDPETPEDMARIRHHKDNRNKVSLGTPDGQYFDIEQLQGSLLFQAIDEFDKALKEIETVKSPNDDLDPAEQEAINNIMHTSGAESSQNSLSGLIN